MKSYNLKIIMHSYENLGDSGSENFLKNFQIYKKRLHEQLPTRRYLYPLCYFPPTIQGRIMHF